MKLYLATIALLATAGIGCEEDRREPPPQPVVVEPAPPPVVYYPDYYYVDGGYYHWHPEYHRWERARVVPHDARIVRRDRLPERPEYRDDRGRYDRYDHDHDRDWDRHDRR